jgi:HK97 family phage major capsid protein
VPEQLVAEQSKEFVYSFEAKSDGIEKTYNGQVGVFIEGYMAVWDERDRTGENYNLDLSKGSQTREAIERYFTLNPVVLYEHGRDPHVARKAIGRTVEHRIDDFGIWVKDFIPKPPAAAGYVLDVYNKIKSGIYQTFSVAGRFAINRLKTIVGIEDVKEHSVCTVPVQGLATFTLAKSLQTLAEYGLTAQEALEVAYYNDATKAGAVISRANKEKIRQAVAVLEALIGEQDADDDLEEAQKALSTLQATLQQGVKTVAAKQSTTTQEEGKQPAGNEEANGTVTLSVDEAKAFKEMMEEREQLRLEKEANLRAEAALKAEAEKAEKEKADQEAREAEIDKRVQTLLAEKRSGVTMLHAAAGGGNNVVSTFKSFNINKIGQENRFSFIKFAAHGLKGREYEYMENVYKSYGYTEKAINETSGSGGGYLVPTEQSTEIVDLLRTQAVCRAMGARVVPMSSDTLSMPRLTGGATAQFVAEGATLSEGNQTFGQIKFVARKIYALVRITKEMMRDSNPGIEAIVNEDIAAQLALGEDNGFLQGNGIGENPLGIINTIGVGGFAYVTGTASAAPEFKSLMKGAALIRSNSAQPTGIVMNSRITDQIGAVIDTNGQPIAQGVVGGYKWAEMQAATMGSRQTNNPNQVEIGTLLGMKQANSNQLTVTATTNGTGSVIIGDWKRFYIGDRQDLEIEIDRSIGFLSDTVYIKATKRVDCVLTIPNAFAVITVFPAIDVA